MPDIRYPGRIKGALGRISGYLKRKQPKTCVWVLAVGEKEFCKGLGRLKIPTVAAGIFRRPKVLFMC